MIYKQNQPTQTQTQTKSNHNITHCQQTGGANEGIQKRTKMFLEGRNLENCSWFFGWKGGGAQIKSFSPWLTLNRTIWLSLSLSFSRSAHSDTRLRTHTQQIGCMCVCVCMQENGFDAPMVLLGYVHATNNNNKTHSDKTLALVRSLQLY